MAVKKVNKTKSKKQNPVLSKEQLDNAIDMASFCIDENGDIGGEKLRKSSEKYKKELEERKLDDQGLRTGNLTLKQEKFCELFVSDKEFFGNGVQSYIEAYDPDCSKPNWYKTAKASASRLLTNVNILKRINELLETGLLNNENVDKQLSIVVMQNVDYGSKIRAINEFNKLKQRITEKKEVKITNTSDILKEILND